MKRRSFFGCTIGAVCGLLGLKRAPGKVPVPSTCPCDCDLEGAEITFEACDVPTRSRPFGDRRLVWLYDRRTGEREIVWLME